MANKGTRSHTTSDQRDLFDSEDDVAVSLISQLLRRSSLYRTGSDYKALLNFVVRLSNFAPFNAMLLEIQRPGLQYAASAHDWHTRLNRTVKEGARPLIILWPFAPVALVYDLDDTEGDTPLPKDVANPFRATGPMSARRISMFVTPLDRLGIDLRCINFGDGKAGHLEALRAVKGVVPSPKYRIRLNARHNPNVQFDTLAHELAHLFLGHVRADTDLKIPERSKLGHDEQEIEAESVAYVVCLRNGVQPESESYLSEYVTNSTTADRLDLYAILKAAGQVETALGLSAHISFKAK